MKTKTFQTIMSIFALVLALTFSFAFKSTTIIESNLNLAQGYIQVLDSQDEIKQCRPSIMCTTNGCTICTIEFGTIQVFGKTNSSKFNNCIIVLYKK